MATSTTQRVGIWVIAIAMTLGTVVGFIVMIMSSSGEQSGQEALQKYQTAAAEYQKKVDVQSKQLSKQYYDSFKQYASVPAPFKSADVKKLETKDLKVGAGKTINNKTAYAAYYIGWNPKGTVFYKSIDSKSLKAPIDPSVGLIAGWNKGVIGMKVGGVRELTIPSDLAYGKKGGGDSIPPNTPIKFVIMAIPKPESIPQPQPSQEVIDAYQQQQQQ